MDKLDRLSDTLKVEQNLLLRLAEGQMELKPILERLATQKAAPQGGFDDATRGHVRNLEVLLSRLVEDSSQGRAEMIQELRAEFRLLARTIAAKDSRG